MSDTCGNCQPCDGGGVEVLAAEYAEGYYGIHRRRYLDQDAWVRQRIADVLSALRPCRGERILDVGRGIGMISLECCRRGADVTAVDYSEVAIRMARALELDVLGKCEIDYRCVDAKEIGRLEPWYDKAVAADFIEHVSAGLFETFLREVKQLIPRGGGLVLYTPNGPVLPTFAQKVVRLVGLLPPFRQKCTMHSSPAEAEDAHDEDYERLHVDVKTAVHICASLISHGFNVEKVACSRGSSHLQRLPYPYNVLWGGHLCVRARRD